MTNEDRSSFGKGLEEFMKMNGFKGSYKSMNFIKKEKFGFYNLIMTKFTMGGAGGWIELNPVLQVRHSAVNEIVDSMGFIDGVENQRKSPTLYRGLAQFPFGEIKEWPHIIRFENFEIDKAAFTDKSISMMQKYGFDFFQGLSTIKLCSIGLNNPIKQIAHPLGNLFPKRAYYGLVSAVISEPERVDNLLNSYSEYVYEESIRDPLMYNIGMDLPPQEAIVKRCNHVVNLARSKFNT